MGKPKHSNDPRGDIKGAQEHAEGQRGPKAHAAFQAEIADHERSRDRGTIRAGGDPNRAGKQNGGQADLHEELIARSPSESDGGHPLFENRVQHDPAERASDKNRITRDVQRHKHDREEFQVKGGNDTHPALPQDAHVRVKSTGAGGGNRADEDRGQG